MFLWDMGIGFVLATAVLLYLAGRQRDVRDEGRTPLPQQLRSLTVFVAFVLLLVTLYSPLHSLATRYFYIHVLQRLLLVSLIPCLFISSDPFPILRAGLPIGWQASLKQLPQKMPRLYTFWVRVTSPLPVWFLFVATFWLWHDVEIDRLVLQAGWIHRLENVTLLTSAIFYWWHIMAASPRLHPPMPALWRVAYAAMGATPIKLVGLVLMFTSTAVYQYPADIQMYDLAVTDQSIGAAIVWAVGGVVFTWTAVLLMRDWLKGEDEKPSLPESIWSSEELMLAPGFGKKSSFRPPTK